MPAKKDKFWARFPSHTKLKHAILRAYLGAWARIHRQGGHKVLWYVDGFAGRGRDSEGTEGSPVIACRIAESLVREATHRSTGAINLRVVAVEQDRRNYKELEKSLSPYMRGPAPPVCICGSINDVYQEFLERTSSDPALFFLDPWGVEGLDAKMIAAMLGPDKHEVLVLFSEQSTHRLRAAVRAPSRRPKLDGTLELFESSPQAIPDERYREADERILNRVFADLWHLVDQTAEMNPGQELDSYLESYVQIQLRLGAEYVLPMSITDESDEHQYSLVHASKHGKAVAAMKEALHTAMRMRSSESPLSLFRFTAPGIGRLCDQICEAFAGQTVRWQDGKRRDTVKRYVMEETWALMSDMSDIKAELAPFLSTRVPATYSFPKIAIVR